MQKPTTRESNPHVFDNDDGYTTFEITMSKVVGEIIVDPAGDGPPPHIAAFMVIAGQDEPGEYQFPMANGQMCVVNYEYRGEPS